MANTTRELRRRSPGSIPYALMEGSPTFDVSFEEVTGAEDWLIEATNINSLALEICPPPVVLGGVLFQPVGINLPGTVLLSQSVSFKPHGSGLPMDPFLTDPEAPDGTYEQYAVASIKFRLDKTDDKDPDDPETFLTHSLSAGAKINAIPPQGTKLNNQNNKDHALPISKVVPTIEHSLKWERVLTPNWSLILSYLGKTNSNTLTFDSGFYGAPNTVLFTGVSGTRKYLWNGFSTSVDPWNLDFKFSHRYITDDNVIDGPAGWNHIYNPKTGRWEIVILPNGSSLYSKAPLENLFR